MTILANLWPFKKRLTPEQTNRECPGSGSLWDGKYRRIRCSTSNGLERHLPGDYQTSLRYFAYCPHCKLERAITKGKRLFVKHTTSPDYHPSHVHLHKFALELATVSRREVRTIAMPTVKKEEPVTAESLGVSELHGDADNLNRNRVR